MMCLLNYIKVEYQPFLFLIPVASELLTSGIIIIYQKIIKKSKITTSLFDKLD
jgi:hypothetical protein